MRYLLALLLLPGVLALGVSPGIVEYDTHFGWKCSEKGDKSFVWFSQKNVDGTSNTINVSEENCQ